VIIDHNGWLLACGHTIRFTIAEFERRDAGTLEPPRRPRMCPVCGRPRNVQTAAERLADTQRDI
jgi:hypothetical protein